MYCFFHSTVVTSAALVATAGWYVPMISKSPTESSPLPVTRPHENTMLLAVGDRCPNCSYQPRHSPFGRTELASREFESEAVAAAGASPGRPLACPCMEKHILRILQSLDTTLGNANRQFLVLCSNILIRIHGIFKTLVNFVLVEILWDVCFQ